jgi:hypothetical protein
MAQCTEAIGRVMNVTWENQPWAEAYRLAVLGVDRNLRAARIRKAKKVMHARIEELTGSQEGQHELTALNDALVILRVWEKDVA